MKRVLKWNVLVDDKTHEIGAGKVVHVACQHDFSLVQVWTEEFDSPGSSTKRKVKVYGTGGDVPDFHDHIGSVVTAGGALVWHVYALPIPVTAEDIDEAVETIRKVLT